MGRKKILNPEGKFLLRTNLSPDPQGRYHVNLQYIIDRKQALSTTGVWLKESEWDALTQRVRPCHGQAKRLNNQLYALRAKVDELILAFMTEGRGHLTVEIVRSMMSGTYDPKAVIIEEKEGTDFFEITSGVLELEYKTGKLAYSTYYNGERYMENFRKYLIQSTGNSKIDVRKVTEQMIDDYILWRLSKGNDSETINKALTPIIKGLRTAANRNHIQLSFANLIESKYLPKRQELSEEDVEDSTVNYLTEEQLNKFIALYPKVHFPRTRDFMDMFLFSFHACGLRFSDILTLQWKHINFETRILRKLLFKGNKPHEFKLDDVAIEILEKWKDSPQSGKVFVFGLLPDDFDLKDKAELNKQRQNKNRCIRTSLNEIGRKIGLPFNLGMHTARHTWAVMALDRLRDVALVSHLLAHSSVDVTTKVYAKFLPETVNRELDKLQFDFRARVDE